MTVGGVVSGFVALGVSESRLTKPKGQQAGSWQVLSSCPPAFAAYDRKCKLNKSFPLQLAFRLGASPQP